MPTDTRRLEAFHMRCQRQTLQIRWFDFISNVDVTARTELPPLTDIIIRRLQATFGIDGIALAWVK